MAWSDILSIGTNEPDTLWIAGHEESYEKIKSELLRFGLTPNEVKIYLHLARIGPMKASEISKSLQIHRTEAYHLLTSLQGVGLISATFEHPVRFSAIPFEKALETLIQAEKEKLFSFEVKISQLINLWETLPKKNVHKPSEERFQILEGMEHAFTRARQMIWRAEQKACVLASEIDLARVDQCGLIDELIDAQSGRNLAFRLLTNLSHRPLDTVGGINDNVKLIRETCTPLPHFIVIDAKELLFFIRGGDIRRKVVTALWTNYATFVNAMQIFFEELWRRAETVDHKSSKDDVNDTVMETKS